MTVNDDDPRIERGMRAQIEIRRQHLDAGAKPLGWKAGFGAPAAMARLGISAPLIGFMTDRSIIQSGAEVSIVGWTKPIAEPEIAVYLSKDLASGVDRPTAAAAVAAIGPAIELVDLDHESTDPQVILAGNIYHRHVVLGPPDPARAGARLDDLSGRVWRNGREIADVTDLQANTGDILDVVRHVARVLATFGPGLRANEIIICGSLVAPIVLEPSDSAIGFKFDPGSDVGVRFATRGA